MVHRPEGSILVTGATGFVGHLLAAALVANEDSVLVLPHRGRHRRNEILDRIGRELRAAGYDPGGADEDRLVTVPLPPVTRLEDLLPTLERYAVTDVVHSAGSLSYFNSAKLQNGNLDLTRGLLELAETVGVARFVYISTAFACGYPDGPVRECLHPEPENDPTEYTRSKRMTERLVASAGVPSVILRPSIVIGHSQDGRYPGKMYGLYQFWAGLQKIFGEEYRPEMHFVAPRRPLPLLHQDALQAAFVAAYRHLPDGAVAHITSREATLPTVDSLYDMAMTEWLKPRRVFYYQTLEDVPLRKLDEMQRLFVEMTAVNMDISAQSWKFETTALESLRDAGHLVMEDATVKTVGNCFHRFLGESADAEAYFDANADELCDAPEVVRVTSEGN